MFSKRINLIIKNMNSQYPIKELTFEAKLQFKHDKTHMTHLLPFYLPYSTGSREVRLNQAFEYAHTHEMIPAHCQIFLADYANCVNVFIGQYPFQQDIKIKYQAFINNVVQFSVKDIEQSKMIDEKELMLEEEKKTKKVRERSIGQAFRLVKLWREMYDKADKYGKRLYTLEEVAKKIGISKKTLDDYFNHIQIAHQFKFNFEKFHESKIGILRKFVKIIKQEGQNGLLAKMSDYIIDNDTDKYWADF